jgi:hypothetical protein
MFVLLDNKESQFFLEYVEELHTIIFFARSNARARP